MLRVLYTLLSAWLPSSWKNHTGTPFLLENGRPTRCEENSSPRYCYRFRAKIPSVSGYFASPPSPYCSPPQEGNTWHGYGDSNERRLRHKYCPVRESPGYRQRGIRKAGPRWMIFLDHKNIYAWSHDIKVASNLDSYIDRETGSDHWNITQRLDNDPTGKLLLYFYNIRVPRKVSCLMK